MQSSSKPSRANVRVAGEAKRIRGMTVTYNGVRLEIPDARWAEVDEYIRKRLFPGVEPDEATFEKIMAERWAVKNEPKKG